MSVAALILLIVTVLAGTALLAEVAVVLTASRPVMVLVSTHVLLATAAVVLWILALIGDTAGLAWGTFVALLAVVALGATALVRTLRPGVAPQGTKLPRGVMIVHGAAAAVTVVLVLIAALTR